MLEIADLGVCYARSVTALRGVSLHVPDGAVVAVLGANGAGKSTLLRAVTGTLRRHRGEVVSGEVRLRGRSLLGLAPEEVVRHGVAHVPEGRRIFGHLTVEENLRAAGALLPRADRAPAREQVYDMFPVLAGRRHDRAALLSGGEQQLLAFGRGLIVSPTLLLLDEPSLGLAPRVVSQVGDVIRRINAAGVSVLLVEQNVALAFAVARHAYVFEVGQVALTGNPDRLKDGDQVRSLYLGHSAARDAPVGEAGATVPTLSRWPR